MLIPLLLHTLCGCTLLTVPFAVSAGMAFTGFLRPGVWALSFLYAATYTGRAWVDILNAAAYEKAILLLMAIVGFLYDAAVGAENPNGRIDGFSSTPTPGRCSCWCA